MNFLKPQLAHRGDGQTDHLLTDAHFAADEKLDGERCQIHIAGHQTVGIYNRSGKAMTTPRTAWLRARRWTIGAAILDGELLMPAGPPSRCYVVFDVLEVSGTSLLSWAWHARRDVVEALTAQEQAAPQIRASRAARTADDKLALFATIRAEGGEGVVLKRITAPYQPGSRSPEWVKYISPDRKREYDVVITGLTDQTSTSQPYKTGEVSLTYGAYSRDRGCAVTCGSLGVIGTRDTMQAHVGKVAIVHAWLQYPSGALRHPHFLRFRDDKAVSECTAEAVAV